jgi:hypothetical protein
MNRLVTVLAGGLITILSASLAVAQAPGNRELHRISVVPDPGGSGLHIVTAHWSVDVESTSSPLDYSTEVLLFVGTSLVESQTASVILDGGSGGSCPLGPPCSGSCGSGTVNGASVTLSCYEDDCDAAGCDCDCGVWIDTPFSPVALAPGDLVEVVLRAFPGTAPDNDDTDNGVDEPYEGQPLAWNREVEGMALTQVAEGEYAVEAWGRFSFEGVAGRLNLDSSLELLVNGVPWSSVGIPAQADQIFDQGCFAVGCGNGCGSINGIPAYCDPYLWWDCGCGGGWIWTFETVPLEPGDEIAVILRPAPGALPTLPGFDEDDEEEETCCPTVGVADAATAVVPPRLAQNRPNPFTPRTSIGFDLDHGGHARLDVLDPSGRRVATLLDRNLSGGSWAVTWDGRASTGEAMAAGTYFYRLTTEHGVETRTMTLVR